MTFSSKRKIVLDTETTGMNKFGCYYEGHRIIEIGAVEILNRNMTGRFFHVYINPNRIIDPDALNIHGINNVFLKDKPVFSQIVKNFIDFINGSELIIHNAKFDVDFINYEFSMLQGSYKNIETFCTITDTLTLARKMFPGKRNSLDALCERYSIDISKRVLHNAMLDAKILAEVFFLMTGGQISMDFSCKTSSAFNTINKNVQLKRCVQQKKSHLHVIYATHDEIEQHKHILDLIYKKSHRCIWNS